VISARQQNGWSTGHNEDCSGPERWFSTTVPAGELLIVDAPVDIVFTYLQLFDLTLADGESMSEVLATAIVSSSPGQMAWLNAGIGEATVVLSLPNEWGGSTALTSHTAPPGCGDGYLDGAAEFGAPGRM
jgi:hypothetical protein